jgi:hypothetical protein
VQACSLIYTLLMSAPLEGRMRAQQIKILGEISGHD